MYTSDIINIMANRKENHRTRLIRFLKKHGSITSLQAINELGNTRLAATIFELRDRGYNIETKDMMALNRYGDKVKVAMYVLKEDNKENLTQASLEL